MLSITLLPWLEVTFHSLQFGSKEKQQIVFADHLPTMQEKINEMLDTVPDVADYLNEQIDEIPDEYRGKMAEMMVSVLEYIPENALPQLQRGLDNGYIKDAVDDHLRVLPSKNSMKRFLTHITELIEGDGWVPPAKERVQERVDEVLKL